MTWLELIDKNRPDKSYRLKPADVGFVLRLAIVVIYENQASLTEKQQSKFELLIEIYTDKKLKLLQKEIISLLHPRCCVCLKGNIYNSYDSQKKNENRWPGGRHLLIIGHNYMVRFIAPILL